MSQNVKVYRTLDFYMQGGANKLAGFDCDDSASIIYFRPTTHDTGALYFGDGTKDMDVRFYTGSGIYTAFDVGIDAIVLVGMDIDLSASATGTYDLILRTAVADALSIKDSAGDLMVFVTTTDAQSVNITPAVSITGALSLASDIDMSASATGVYDLILKDAVADALSIRRAATDMVVFDSTTPAITITPATTITGQLSLGGVLKFGTFTTEADAVSVGFMNVTDAGGTVRKVMIK